VKSRILNIGVAATSDRFTDASVLDATSISDYDAFIFDPESVGTQLRKL
jgi:hypothetical protein